LVFIQGVTFGLFEEITDAVKEIRKRTDIRPRFAIILGTGLGRLAEEIKTVAEIEYAQFPIL